MYLIRPRTRSTTSHPLTTKVSKKNKVVHMRRQVIHIGDESIRVNEHIIPADWE